MKKLLLIVNPCSGKKRARTNLYSIIKNFNKHGFEVTVRFTEERGHAITLAKEYSLREDIEYIICCGGDGTLNETINGVVLGDRSKTIGYIPMGSTNDFASSMNISTNIKEAVKNIYNGKPAPLDIGSFDGRFFSYIASFGAFTSVSYNTKQQFKNAFGHLAYVLEGIKDITTIRPYHVKTTAGDKKLDGEYIFGAVTNSTSVAGIVKIDEEFVDVNDGLFEVILVKKPKNILELHEIVQGCFASDFSGKMFEFFKASEIIFETDEPESWSVDGEKADAEKIVKINNLHNYINFIK